MTNSIARQRIYMSRAVDSERSAFWFNAGAIRRVERHLVIRIAEVLEREVLVAAGVDDKDEPASAALYLVEPEVFGVAAV